MPKKTRVEIPVSFFEYQAFFAEPLFNVQRLWSDVVRGVFGAFRSYGVSLENVSAKERAQNLGEVGATFSLFQGTVFFTVELGSVRLFAKNVNWSHEPMVADVVSRGLAAVLRTGDLVVESQRASIVMHLKPESGSPKDLVMFLMRPAPEVLGDNIRGYGFSVYKERSNWVVDASALVAGGLYMRLEHFGPKDLPFNDLTSKLASDQVTLWGLLNLELS